MLATLESSAGDASRDDGKLPGRSEGEETCRDDVRLDSWAGVKGSAECDDDGAGVARELGGGTVVNQPDGLRGGSLALLFFIKRGLQRGGQRGCNCWEPQLQSEGNYYWWAPDVAEVAAARWVCRPRQTDKKDKR